MVGRGCATPHHDILIRGYALDHPLLTCLLERGRQQRPLIGAHRGASARAPENTLAAFRAAIDDGAEMIELDVHLTRDGELAVIHDSKTRRTTGVGGMVARLEMARLRRLDAGRHKGSDWAGEGIPTLDDVLALARGRLIVNVEIKGGLAAVPAVARGVASAGMRESVVVSSFDRGVVAAATGVRPPLLAGLLLERPGANPLAAARSAGASLLHVEHSQLTSPLVELLHGAGLGVLAWTVHDPAEMRRLAAMGVDAILSDDPRLLRETVG